MHRKGSMLIHIVIMLFFLGIMAITFLPILISSINSFQSIKTHDEMIFIGEMVCEKIKANAIDVLNISDIDYEDEDFDTDTYNCNISRIDSDTDLLEFIIKVENKNGSKVQHVEFKVTIPKP